MLIVQRQLRAETTNWRYTTFHSNNIAAFTNCHRSFTWLLVGCPMKTCHEWCKGNQSTVRAWLSGLLNDQCLHAVSHFLSAFASSSVYMSSNFSFRFQISSARPSILALVLCWLSLQCVHDSFVCIEIYFQF